MAELNRIQQVVDKDLEILFNLDEYLLKLKPSLINLQSSNKRKNKQHDARRKSFKSEIGHRMS